MHLQLLCLIEKKQSDGNCMSAILKCLKEEDLHRVSVTAHVHALTCLSVKLSISEMLS